MSTVEPPDMDDEFRKLIERADLAAPLNVENVALLNDVELSSRYNSVRQELLSRGEMMMAKTETGRELHSQRTAYLIEMRKRRMA